MWKRMALAITVVLLGFSGGVFALFVRGMHAGPGAVAGFCFVSAVAAVQAWLVASEIAKAGRLCGNIRNACYRGAQAKFRAVSLVGLCAIVGVLPPGIDWGKLGSTRPIRHRHARWCGVFHYCSVDRAACPHFTDRRVKWVFCCGSTWSSLTRNRRVRTTEGMFL
jgi:hypothetical protein